MGASAVAFRKPRQEALLEEIRGIGVVVRARRIDEHVAEARVSVDVGPPCMVQQGLQRTGGDPVVGVRRVYTQSHVEAPVASEITGRQTSSDEHQAVDHLPLLSEQLGGKCAERESDHSIRLRVLAGRPAGDLFDCIVTDAASEGQTLVQSVEDCSRVDVGGVDLVARSAETLSHLAQSLSEALSVMKEDDLGDTFSVRLSGALRQSVLLPS